MENIRNKVCLMGFAGSDVLVVELANQKRLGRVSIAINESFKNSAGESINQTQWFNLVFWNKKADLASYLIKKGALIKIEGKLNTQAYTDKNGIAKQAIEIVVNEIELVEKEDTKDSN